MYLVFFGLIMCLCGVILAFVKDDHDRITGAQTFVAVLLVGIGAIIVHEGIQSFEPRAIDVYRGKTTLEITYKDSIPVDTVVVFK